MEQFKIGDRVALTEAALSVPYIAARKNYTIMYAGKVGTVIAISVGDNKKLGIEFDDKVFTQAGIRQSSHDNGCNGKGKLHYCWYIPIDCVDLIPNTINEQASSISPEMQKFFDNISKDNTDPVKTGTLVAYGTGGDYDNWSSFRSFADQELKRKYDILEEKKRKLAFDGMAKTLATHYNNPTPLSSLLVGLEKDPNPKEQFVWNTFRKDTPYHKELQHFTDVINLEEDYYITLL